MWEPRPILALMALLIASPSAYAGNVFGKDDRVSAPGRAAPYNKLVWVNQCTGAVVWKNLVLTAAHCISDHLGTNPDGSRFIKTPLPVWANCDRALICLDWAYATQIWWGGLDYKTDTTVDWAIIAINSNFGDRYGAFGILEDLAADGPMTKGLTLAGYGGDRVASDGMTVHVGCDVREVLPNGKVHHDCDMTRGNSGAPLFKCDSAGLCYIAALNVAEFRNDGEVSLFAPEYEVGVANVALNPRLFQAKISELRALFPNGAR